MTASTEACQACGRPLSINAAGRYWGYGATGYGEICRPCFDAAREERGTQARQDADLGAGAVLVANVVDFVAYRARQRAAPGSRV